MVDCHPHPFSWKQLNMNYPARMIPCDDMVKSNIVEHLVNNKIEFNSYPNKSSRKREYIVRGLSMGNDDLFVTDITSTLTAHGITGDTSVKRFITGKMKREPELTPVLFSIIVAPDVNDANICNIKRVGTFHVVIEKMKKSAVATRHLFI